MGKSILQRRRFCRLVQSNICSALLLSQDAFSLTPLLTLFSESKMTNLALHRSLKIRLRCRLREICLAILLLKNSSRKSYATSGSVLVTARVYFHWIHLTVTRSGFRDKPLDIFGDKNFCHSIYPIKSRVSRATTFPVPRPRRLRGTSIVDDNGDSESK